MVEEVSVVRSLPVASIHLRGRIERVLLVLRRDHHSVGARVMTTERWTNISTAVHEHLIFVHQAVLLIGHHCGSGLGTRLLLWAQMIRIRLNSARHHRAGHLRSRVHPRMRRLLHRRVPSLSRVLYRVGRVLRVRHSIVRSLLTIHILGL